METVSTKPEYGSVEHFADRIRKWGTRPDDVMYCMTGVIKTVIDYEHRTDAEKVELVRNALAAAELVRAEMRQRD